MTNLRLATQKHQSYVELKWWVDRLRWILPQGGTLPEATWQGRHRAVLWLLWIHAATIIIIVLMTGQGLSHALVEGGLVALLALLASLKLTSRRFRATAASIGLMSCSAILVHLSGGYIEFHFHFFVMLGVISLYQDWAPFLAAVGYVVLHHGFVGVLYPRDVYNHPDAWAHPWKWAAIHGAFVLAASIAGVVAWRFNESLRSQSETILNSAGEGIIGLDAMGHTTFINPAAAQLLDAPAAALIRHPLHQILRWSPSDGVAAATDAYPLYAPLHQGEIYRATDGIFWRQDGHKLPIECVSTPMWERGELVGAVVTLRDVTERKRAEEALRASEEHYRLLFESNPMPMWAFDVETLRFLAVNQAAIAHYGYSRDEYQSMTIMDIRPLEEVPRLVANLANASQQPEHAGVWKHRKRDGTLIDAEITSQIILFGGQEARLVLAHDVTARLQRERELEAIATVSAALRIAPSRVEMLPIILDQLMDLLNVDGAAIALRNPTNGETLTELGRGAWAGATRRPLLSGAGMIAQVMATTRPYLTNQAQADPLLAQADWLAGIHAVACVPLIAREQTLGAMWVGHTRDIDSGQMRLLNTIAELTGNAIHRTRLYEETEQRLQRLTALRAIDIAITNSLDLNLTLDILLEHVLTQLHADAADILLLNPHTQTLEYTAGRGFQSASIQRSVSRIGQGYAGRAALERHMIRLPDLAEEEPDLSRGQALVGERFQAYFGVPLVAKGQVAGVLEIFQRTPLYPDPDWLAFLEALAGQAAIAIDNAGLFSQLQRSNLNLRLAYDATIEGWSRALDLRDKETEGHTQRVTGMTLQLARAIGIDEDEIVHLRRGALLHDIGKMGVPDHILLKPGPLKDDEWAIMRQHPVYAYEMLSTIHYLRQALDIPYNHHEKWDGTGYPRGLKGEQIPLAARLFAVVDVWDALRSDRPYRQGWPEEKVRDHIQALAGTHFDPQVVNIFLQLLAMEAGAKQWKAPD